MTIRISLLALVLSVTGSAFAQDAELKKIGEALNDLKITGYLHAQYVDDFTIRRARLKLTYQAHKTSRLVIAPDFGNSDVVLKDAYVELTEPWTKGKHTLTTGQFLYPFGFEITYSSSAREVPERSRVMRTLFSGERDRGVMFSGAGLADRFRYNVAIVNGTGINGTPELRQRKDVIGRVKYRLGALDLGASIYRGEDLVATAANARGEEFDKHRQGIDFQWTTPLKGLALRGEYITGRHAPPSGTTRRESFDVEGWYFYAIQNLGMRHQLAVRVDEYDGDTDSSGDAIRTLVPAYTFAWDAHSKVMLAYEMPRRERNDPDDDAFTLRYQFSF